jgi:hypothetical protein
MTNKPSPMYKLQLLLKHNQAGAKHCWLAGVQEIYRSTLNVYWPRIESINTCKVNLGL